MKNFTISIMIAAVTAAICFSTMTVLAEVGESTKTGTPGGSDTQVQFNDGGIMAGDAGMTYDSAADDLTVIGNVDAATFSGDGSSLTNIADGSLAEIYALLAGRAGGQSMAGGTASGNDLTLRSNTSDDGDIVLTDDILFSRTALQDYQWSNRGELLTLQGLTPATRTAFEMFSKDGDATDSVQFKIWGMGTPTDVADAEVIVMDWDAASSSYRLYTTILGSGTLRPLEIKTDGFTGQLFIDTDGQIGINEIDPDGMMHLDGRVDEVQLIVDGHSTQTNHIQDWRDSAESVLAYIAGNGDFSTTGDVSATLLSGDGSAVTNVAAVTSEATSVTCKVNEAAGISKGQAVYVSGATGQFAQVSLADNTDTIKEHMIGIATETKADNQNIIIRVHGEVTTLDTSTPGWLDGDPLFLSTAGALTKTEPTSGAVVHIGHVTYSHSSQGKIMIFREHIHQMAAPANESIKLRLGDAAGATSVNIHDYADASVATINSDGDIGAVDCTLSGDLHVANMKTGVDQAGAGAAAGELWAESDAGFVVHLGQ